MLATEHALKQLPECLLMYPTAIFHFSAGTGSVVSDKAPCLSDGAVRRDRLMCGDRLPVPGHLYQPIQPVGNDRCPD